MVPAWRNVRRVDRRWGEAEHEWLVTSYFQYGQRFVVKVRPFLVMILPGTNEVLENLFDLLLDQDANREAVLDLLVLLGYLPAAQRTPSTMCLRPNAVSSDRKS
jgi:hypothetical protein